MRKLIILVIALISLGCSKKVYYPEYKVQLIERPQPPVLLELDPNKHISNVVNVDRLLENTTRLLDYSEALNDTIDKYEIQAVEVQKEIKNK